MKYTVSILQNGTRNRYHFSQKEDAIKFFKTWHDRDPVLLEDISDQVFLNKTLRECWEKKLTIYSKIGQLRVVRISDNGYVLVPLDTYDAITHLLFNRVNTLADVEIHVGNLGIYRIE